MSDTEGAVLEAPRKSPADSGGTADTVIVAFWLSDAARTRLVATDSVVVIDDPARIADAGLLAVSTRIPAGSSPLYIAELREQVSVPIVAIVHPGDEDIAVDMLRNGASGLVAEGNEGSIVAYLGRTAGEPGMVSTYEQTIDRRSSRPGLAVGDRDPVTKLRGPPAMASRLAREAGGFLPRLAFARLIAMDETTRRMSTDARDLLRRRIALQFEELCSHHGAEVFTVDSGEFAVVADNLGPLQFEVLGRELVAVAARFSPDRTGALMLAVGHAGPEATSQVETLEALARQGMQHAASHPDIGVIGPDRLALSLAAGTELASVLKAIESVEARDAYPGAHGMALHRRLGPC